MYRCFSSTIIYRSTTPLLAAAAVTRLATATTSRRTAARAAAAGGGGAAAAATTTRRHVCQLLAGGARPVSSTSSSSWLQRRTLQLQLDRVARAETAATTCRRSALNNNNNNNNNNNETRGLCTTTMTKKTKPMLPDVVVVVVTHQREKQRRNQEQKWFGSKRSSDSSTGSSSSSSSSSNNKTASPQKGMRAVDIDADDDIKDDNNKAVKDGNRKGGYGDESNNIVLPEVNRDLSPTDEKGRHRPVLCSLVDPLSKNTIIEFRDDRYNDEDYDYEDSGGRSTGNGVRCYPLWIIDDTNYSGMMYVVGKPEYVPVALYAQEGRVGHGDGDGAELEPPMYVSPYHEKKWLKNDILPLIQEELQNQYPDKLYRIRITPQSLQLMGPPMNMEEYRGHGQMDVLVALELKSSSSGEADLTEKNQGDGDVLRLWLLRPQFPILHIARIWQSATAPCYTLLDPEACAALIPRVQNGNAHAQESLLTDFDFLMNGTTHYLFAGDGLVVGANGGGNGNGNDEAQAATTAVPHDDKNDHDHDENVHPTQEKELQQQQLQQQPPQTPKD